MTEVAEMIRVAVADDADGIAQVHTLSWQAAYRGIIADDFLDALDWQRRAAGWRRQLDNPLLGTTTLVSTDATGTIGGFAMTGPTRDDNGTAPGDFELYSIYVHPETWRRGLGSALLARALATTPPSATRVTLWVLTDNDQGRAFYERHGFRPDGETRTEDVGAQSVEEIRYARPVGQR